MTQLTSRIARVLVGMVIATLGVVGLAAVSAAAPAPAPVSASVQQAACGVTTGFTQVALSTLPKQATDTVNLIKKGGPFPFPKNDNVVFTNREGILPACASSYYHEYTVITPGAPTRGTRRIVTGSAGEYFYTADHYKTFVLVNINA